MKLEDRKNDITESRSGFNLYIYIIEIEPFQGYVQRFLIQPPISLGVNNIQSFQDCIGKGTED